MTAAARRIEAGGWSKERFLEWAAARPGDARYEFDGAQPVAMAPATLGHNDIGRNIRALLRDLSRTGTGCRAYGPQQAIETVGGALREPDAFIACSANSRGSIAIAAPVIVFEVVSPGRESRRRHEEEKADEYEAVPSILRYIIVESERRGASVFWRRPGERAWRKEAFDGQGPLAIAEFGIELAFDDIYDGVVFDLT